MVRTLFFRKVLRKSSEITSNKPTFSQYNVNITNINFTNINISFFNLRFDLFSAITKKVNQVRTCSLCCSSPCFRVLLCTH